MTVKDNKTLAVYICSEHGKIGDEDQLSKIQKALETEENLIDIYIHPELCSREGLNLLLKRFKDHKPDGVLLVCSTQAVGDKIRDALVSAGLNKYLFERINLKELWSHVHFPMQGNMINKAISIFRAGLARLRASKPLEDLRIPIRDSVLIIGGGVAGMAAAKMIADAGFKVYLVERESQLGGRAYQLSTTFPTHECGICCMRYCRECILTPKIPEMFSNPNIEVLLNAKVKSITGRFGERHVTVEQNGEQLEFNVGAIVVATGSKTYDPRGIPEYRYDQLEDVITSMEFCEIMRNAAKVGFRRPSDGKIPKRVNFVLCVGSRDRNRANHYCSIVCCTYAIGSAKELKLAHPETEVYVHYIDLRGPYRGFETFVDEAREAGVIFMRGRVAEILEGNDNLIVRCEDTDIGHPVEIESDMVVLAVGQEPSEGADEIERMLRLQTDEDGFMKDFNPMYPEEIRKGIYVVGCAQGPKGIRYSIDDAKRAAAEVIDLLQAGEIYIDNVAAEVNVETCRGCGRCVENCPFEAVTLVEEEGLKKARVNEMACEGCGICSVVCCNKSIKMRYYTRDGILSQVKSVIWEVA